MIEAIINLLKRRMEFVDGLGTLQLCSSGNKLYWLGKTKGLGGNNDQVDLIIHINQRGESLSERVNLVKGFLNEYDSVAAMLYRHIKNSYDQRGDHLSLEEVRRIYVLSSIALQVDKKEWWIVLEPSFEIDRHYEFHPRFILQEGLIKWSNLQ